MSYGDLRLRFVKRTENIYNYSTMYTFTSTIGHSDKTNEHSIKHFEKNVMGLQLLIMFITALRLTSYFLPDSDSRDALVLCSAPISAESLVMPSYGRENQTYNDTENFCQMVRVTNKEVHHNRGFNGSLNKMAAYQNVMMMLMIVPQQT